MYYTHTKTHIVYSWGANKSTIYNIILSIVKLACSKNARMLALEKSRVSARRGNHDCNLTKTVEKSYNLNEHECSQ